MGNKLAVSSIVLRFLTKPVFELEKRFSKATGIKVSFCQCNPVREPVTSEPVPNNPFLDGATDGSYLGATFDLPF